MMCKIIKYTNPHTGNTADFSEYKNLPAIRVTALMPPVKPPKSEPTIQQTTLDDNNEAC